MATVPCPSCGATLESDGQCAFCGGRARGFWHALDLGTPELAAAVMEGLDYYLILGLPPGADPAAVTEAYRQARQRFPDDPRTLVPLVARKLGLIEEAWRILGVPLRRQVYDGLCAVQDARGDGSSRPQGELRTIRCPGCGSPVEPSAGECPACGSERSVEAPPPIAPPVDDVPDYYAVLGIGPSLRLPPETGGRWGGGFGLLAGVWGRETAAAPVVFEAVPPDRDEIELAYLERLQELAYHPDAERELRVEVARRVLLDPGRHTAYLALRDDLRDAGSLARTMQALTALDREVRAEIRGDAAAVDGQALLDQGRGLIQLKLHGPAVPVLQAACQALRESVEAHTLYGMALWGSGEIATLTPHVLRQIDATLTRAMDLDPRLQEKLQPYIDVARGTHDFNSSQIRAAEERLRAATVAHPGFAPAWQMYAAVLLQEHRYESALDACRQALRVEPGNERVLFLTIAACWRQGQVERARDVAAHIARLRGGSIQPEDVLREVGLAR